MKLSVEAKVAAAIAAGFLAVIAGVVAQDNNTSQTVARNESTLMAEPAVQPLVAERFDAQRAQSGDQRK
jgi:hypothetical protein